MSKNKVWSLTVERDYVPGARPIVWVHRRRPNGSTFANHYWGERHARRIERLFGKNKETGRDTMSVAQHRKDMETLEEEKANRRKGCTCTLYAVNAGTDYFRIEADTNGCQWHCTHQYVNTFSDFWACACGLESPSWSGETRQ